MLNNKNWWKAAFVRALRTIAQTAVATIGTAALIERVNWLAVLSASALAGVLSLLTSLAGLPEVREEQDWVAVPSSRGSSRPRDQTCTSCISCIVGGFFTHRATWEDF